MQSKSANFIKYLCGSILLTFFFGGFFVIFFNEQMDNLLKYAWKMGNLQLWLWLYLGVIIGLVCTFKYYGAWSDKWVICLLFCLAFVPRAWLALQVEYRPISDFVNYYKYAVAFLEKNYNFIATNVQSYAIPSFGGLAVLNGVLMRFFSSSWEGFQIAQCFLASCITMPLYKIGKIWNKKAGILAAIIFSFYPSNIIFSQVYTNQHGSILFVLIALWVIIWFCNIYGKSVGKVYYKSATYACIAAICMVISFYFHPSWQTTLIAILIYLVVIVINSWREKQKRNQYLCFALSFFIFAFILKGAGTQLLLNKGIIVSAETHPMTSKIMVGFNPDTAGRYSGEDYALIKSLPKEEQSSAALGIALDRMKSQENLAGFLVEKIVSVWFVSDNSFYWYSQGIAAALAEIQPESAAYEIAQQKFLKIQNNITDFSRLDLLFCGTVFLLAGFGTIFLLRKGGGDGCILPMLALCGWISVHMLIEVQGRYRYFGMTIVFIFAAIGVVTIHEYFQKKIFGKNLIEKEKS